MSYPLLDREVRQKLAHQYNYTLRNLSVDLSLAEGEKSSSFLEAPLADLENGVFQKRFLTAIQECGFRLPLAGADKDEPREDHARVEWELVPTSPLCAPC